MNKLRAAVFVLVCILAGVEFRLLHHVFFLYAVCIPWAAIKLCMSQQRNLRIFILDCNFYVASSLNIWRRKLE